jgi:hypothetical protein
MSDGPNTSQLGGHLGLLSYDKILEFGGRGSFVDKVPESQDGVL